MSVLGRIRDRTVYVGYTAAWRLSGHLSESTVKRAFDRIARSITRRNGRGVQRLRTNLQHVRPDLGPEELDRLTADAMRSYLRYWAEAFRLPHWPLDDLVARTRTTREDVFRAALASERGLVVALPHQANWDWAGAWACATGAPLMTVAERLRPDALFEEFVAFRESLGMTILPLSGGQEPPLAHLETYLREGGFVCLLADRDFGSRAVAVELCDAPAQMPTGAAVLAQRTGALLMAATLHYAGDEMEIAFHGPFDVGPGDDGVATATQELADVFTEGLRRSPADWHMLQRVFLDDELTDLQRQEVG